MGTIEINVSYINSCTRSVPMHCPNQYSPQRAVSRFSPLKDQVLAPCRFQMRGRSYTPSPPRGYGRRGRSPSPRGRNGGRGRGDAPTSLLVRNLRHDCRPEYLKRQFGQFGPVKDVYLPRDYYTGQPRGFGFVQYVDPADALEAKHQMDGEILQGRELTVVFAEENRKKPTDMRARERGGSRTYDRRRSPPRYSRSPQYTRSPPPQYERGRSRSQDYYLSPKTRYSRPVPLREKMYRERSNSLERSHPYNGSRSCSQSPVRERSPYGSRSCSQSPGRGHSPVRAQRSPVPIRRRNRSPPADYLRKPGGDGSPSQ
ncbi:serine arginine-rich SC35-like splicing factor SCL30A [Olea europaea subsp. europaea]|uniref:Serine arginine-rich SC35-like splicing factor SCL30A n=1 Tax=Olea europaea subsp. europaea TaxID=158383 RepID=A0A8S0QX30_OLEEU|nr:serine arginine-rich SC35-like splicing factor SCL30A [Olea europaea subsp. europaea]